MIIKKYVGKTESEATEEAKKELGQNIVIMNVRPLKKSGFFSLFLPQKIEVTVAIEEESERNQKVYTPMQEQRPPLRTPIVEGGQADTMRASMKMNKAADLVDESSAIEEKLDNLSTLLEKNIKYSGKEEDAVESEVKKQDAKPAQPKEEISQEVLSFIKLLYNTLIENEVDEIYVNQLTDEVEKISKPGLPFDFALANVYQKMVLKFGKSEPIEDVKGNGPRAEIFIGPTGVGKTTTIAKLASELSVTQKKKVALFTVDTYRIAAAEQLRTYASILEIPFRVIYSAEEMKQAVEDFRDFDYIMVDTAGHSLHNEELKEYIEKYIR
ncbi:MAG: flagellar biosynthesis protein FlhF, partial [Butyrivibrio sp.]|nr:flagellar biosynthesis protein FlhF [Butyrivibrio sp.]